jgi:hypothetical protein
MRHRATIERDGAAGTNDWGDKPSPAWKAHLEDLACKAWYKPKLATREEIADGTKTVNKGEWIVIVPLGTDVTAADRIASITDRQGNTILAGPLDIKGIGQRLDHIVVTVEAVSSNG